MEDSERQATSIESRAQGTVVTGAVNKFSVHNKKPSTVNKEVECYIVATQDTYELILIVQPVGKSVGNVNRRGTSKVDARLRISRENRKNGKVHQVYGTDSRNSSDDYAFRVGQINAEDDNIMVNVGNVDLKMVVDSVATWNIMGRPI
jgi:hypothetical protein